MPTYAPQDMAYLLRMSKPSGKMTKDLAMLVKPEGLTAADYLTTEGFLEAIKVNLEQKLA